MNTGNRRVDVLIVGGGIGGCAAALAATAMGQRVVLTEETDWIGGQLSAQAVSPDEHMWIERFGCTRRYRRYRDLVRAYYRDNYPLTPQARSDPYLNPGLGYISRLCHEPRVALAVLDQMMALSRTSGLLDVRLLRKPIAVNVDGDKIQSVVLRNSNTGKLETLEADYVIDATELGDLLPLAGIPYRTGSESKDETGELHGVSGPARPDNVQSLTWGLGMGWDPGGKHVINRPAQYAFWRKYVPNVKPEWGGPLLAWERPVYFEDHFHRERTCLFPEEAQGLQHSSIHATQDDL